MTADQAIKNPSPSGRYVVRQWDGMDGVWCDCNKPTALDTAKAIWNERTKNGTRNTTFHDIDYYAIFPAETRMLYNNDYPMFDNDGVEEDR